VSEATSSTRIRLRSHAINFAGQCGSVAGRDRQLVLFFLGIAIGDR